MEQVMNKTVISHLAATIAFTVLPVTLFAMPPKPEISPQYTPSSAWNATLGVNYARFSNNDSAFAESESSDDYRVYNIHNDYHTGYNFGLGYHLPNKNSDLRVDYSHFQSDDSSHVSGDDLYFFSGPVESVGAKLSYEYNKLDFSAGHQIDLTPKFSVGYFGGIDYTTLSREMKISGREDGFNTRTLKAGTEFRGVGPMFGMNGSCHPSDEYPGFGVFGGVNTAFPYGNLSTHERYYENDEMHRAYLPDDKIVVPVVGANLGVEYNLPINKINWNMQLGYQSTTLFGAARDYSGSSSSNVTQQGVFLNLNPRF